MSNSVTTAAAAAPASTGQALEMLTSALGYLAAADATQMPAEVQAECLRALERAHAVQTAARSGILGAFTAGRGYWQDGDYSPRSWLMHQTRITKGAAAGHTGWERRGRAHPRMLAAMVAADMTEPYARTLCGWTDKFPEDCRDAADEILAAATRAGMDLRDLAALAAEILSRVTPDPGDDGPDGSFGDRGVRLETTFAGAGVLSGDLSPECAALVGTVLDALSVPCGADDTRTHVQRYHDALEEAMRRLVAAGLLPDRAGQPVKVLAHISLADLIVLDADSALQEQWTERVRGEWAGHRATASVAGGDGAAWLDGDAAEGFACDGSITPVVFGEVNYPVLDDMVRLCLQLAGHGSTISTISTISAGSAASGSAALLDPVDASDPAGSRDAVPAADAAGDTGTAQVPPGLLSREALERAIIGKAVALVSGPGGLAGFLRREQLGARLAGPSLPLDVGYGDHVPASIRTAVKVRDRFCRWAGGCDQPAAACEVHHLRHKGHGGETSLQNCLLLCHFHHHVMIHRMGWTLVRHPDGTTAAWNRGKTKVLRSHSPPSRTG